MPERRIEAFVERLRQERASAFRKEVVPYFRYVAQSGFGLVASAITFTLLIGYVQLLNEVPAHWPVGIVGSALLIISIIPASLRTYLLPADSVYLLPMERNVYLDYLRPVIRRRIIVGAIRTLAVFAVLVPIYVDAPLTTEAAESRSLWGIAMLFAGLAAWNGYAGWRERQLALPGVRFALRVGRWAATGCSVAGLLLGPVWAAVAFTVASVALCSAAWRLGSRHYVPWERLIQEEAAARRRWFRFLSWFVDVPDAPSKPVKRAWAAWLAKSIPKERRMAWLYLYSLTFLRGESFGAFFRLVLATIVILVAAEGVFADIVIYAVAILAGGLQLTELGRLRFNESAHVVPIPPEQRGDAAASVGRFVGLGAAAVLGAVAFIPSLGTGDQLTISLAAIAAGFGWMGWRIPKAIEKRSLNEDDDF